MKNKKTKNKIQRLQLDRRHFLRGAGISLALPFLEAMLPWQQFSSIAKASPNVVTPKRFLVLTFPCGRVGTGDTAWTPTGTGVNYQLPSDNSVLGPIAPVKADVSILTGFNNVRGHHFNVACYLTGVNTPVSLTEISAGVSADQIIANAIRGDTRLRDFHSIGDNIPNYDGESANRIYYSALSWQSTTQPSDLIQSPQLLFDKLTLQCQGGTGVDQARRKLFKLSVLDAVKQDTQSLLAQLGTQDRQRMDEYFQSVRDLEVNIQSIPTNLPPLACQLGNRPTVGNRRNDFPVRTRVFLDLIVAALRSDVSRTSTYMFGHENPEILCDFLPGVPTGHSLHGISHYGSGGSTEGSRDNMKKMNRWFVEQFVYVIQKLKAIPEQGGTALDNTVVMFGSNMSQSDNPHLGNNLPLIVGGGRNIGLHPGQHINGNNVPISNLLLTLIQKFGVNQSQFGMSNNTVAGL